MNREFGLPPEVRDKIEQQSGANLSLLVTGVSFDAYKRDGSLDWRLRIDQSFLAVNCLSYTRWTEVKVRARDLLASGARAGVAANNPLSAIGLQYIDMFEWEGDVADYDVTGLLRAESDMLPKSIFGKGPLWHLHQGWFTTDDLPAEGRLLERMHLDAVEQAPKYLVKMDCLEQMDLRKGPMGFSKIFENDPLLDEVIELLHTRSKSALGRVITDEMAERIELNA